jgi:hypothetical protein
LLDRIAATDTAPTHATQLAELSAALKATILESKSQGPLNKAAKGLSVYFPQPYLFDAEYPKLTFASAEFGWIDVIRAYAQPHVYSFVDRLRVLNIAGPDLLGLTPERLTLERRRITSHLADVFKLATPLERANLLQDVRRLDIEHQQFSVPRGLENSLRALQ